MPSFRGVMNAALPCRAGGPGPGRDTFTRHSHSASIVCQTLVTPIRILMILAALTLFAASAVHAGLLGPLDPFEGAALPEALIGAVLMAGFLGALVWWPRSWPIAVGATAFAILGTVVGMRFTLPRGEPGDIAYHVGLLGTLLVLAALLLQWRRRHA